MQPTNLFASYFLVHALMLSISTASNVTENEIKGTYYERRKASSRIEHGRTIFTTHMEYLKRAY